MHAVVGCFRPHVGVIVKQAEGRKRIAHGGGIEGFNTSLDYYPESEVLTVVLSNLSTRAVDEISPHLGKLAHGEAVRLTTK